MPPSSAPTELPALTDEQAMRLALAQADAAQAAGEVPVGAVLLRGGQLVATGANAPVGRCDPTAHAEIVALRAAATSAGNYRLDGCTLYVTLEPCPMCAGALLHARLARVVFGAADPRTGAAGSVTDLFADPRLNHHTRVEGGLLASECGAQLQRFFRARRAARSLAAEPLREDALRTPPAAFSAAGASAWEGAYRADLPALEGLRLHYLERGAGQPGPVFVCLHGSADWGQRFATVADTLEALGAPVLVPDLIGFGRSDKPKRDEFHRLDWHVAVLRDWCLAHAHARPVVLVADAVDTGLADRLAAALGDRAAGMLLLPAPATARPLARAGHPDRGHAAALRAFAAGWAPAGSQPAPALRLLRLDGDSAGTLQRAVEYFRA